MQSIPSKTILISSGGTSVPIDGVRSITNFSQGTTGSKIAEECLNKGHTVIYVYSKGSKIPFIGDSESFILNDLIDAVKIKLIRDYIITGKLKLLCIKNFEDYNSILKEYLPKVDIFISAMAVSDYKPLLNNNSKTDLSSNPLQFEKLPKLINLSKTINPKLFLVSFKMLLSNDSTTLNLIEVAYNQMLTSKSNLCVANLVSSEFTPTQTYILSIEKFSEPVSREQLPQVLVSKIEQRYSETYFKTVQKLRNKSNFLPQISYQNSKT